MTNRARIGAAAIGALAMAAFVTPAIADDAMPMMQQNRPGMMGGGGMGMMGPGHGMGPMNGGGMGPGGGMGMMNGGMMGRGMMSGGMGMGMATMHALDLDRDQVRRMTRIHKELAQKHAGMRADLQELQWELSREMAKEKPSPEEVGNLYQRIFEQRRRLIQDQVEARNRMMDALSEEQRQQWRQMMENRQQMRMGGYPYPDGDND